MRNAAVDGAVDGAVEPTGDRAVQDHRVREQEGNNTMDPRNDVGVTETEGHAAGLGVGPGHSEREAPGVTAARAEHASRPWLGWLLAGVAALLVAGFVWSGVHARSEHEERLEQATVQSSTPSVHVVHPSVGGGGAAAKPGANDIVLPANVQGYVDTPIYARTSGYLRKWYFDIGAHVKKGQLLAEIETPELDRQVQQAQSDVKTAEANLGLAQTTAARWDKLLQKNAVSKQEADQANSGLQSSQSNLAAQQANLARLQEMQSFERIYAPFDGVVTARNTDIGALIQAGQNAGPQELFHMASEGRLRVFVPVPEVYQSAVRNGERVAITSDAFPDQRFAGTLVRNARAVDPASRTLNVEVDIDNTDGKLLPGAYAFVHLPVAGASLHGMTIPANTLVFRGEGLQVGVVENNRVVLKPITVGRDYGAAVEVLSGITPDDQVVLDPSDSIETGDPVQVASSPKPAGAAS